MSQHQEDLNMLATNVWQSYFGDYAFMTRTGMRPLIAHEFVSDLENRIAIYAERQVERAVDTIGDKFVAGAAANGIDPKDADKLVEYIGWEILKHHVTKLQ